VRDGIAVVVLTNGDNANPTEIAEALFDAALETDTMAEDAAQGTGIGGFWPGASLQ